MSIDDEKPDFALEISDEANRTIQDQLARSGIAGVLSLVPGVGSAITEMLTELAIRRTNERLHEMFEYFVSRIREVGEEKVDRDWFRGEEFETLLYEAMHQLHATRDREKIKMLGVALANSGMQAFKEDERKDLFIRFVREITPSQIRILVRLVPRPTLTASDFPPGTELPPEETVRWATWHNRPTVTPKDDELLALQMLHAYGLVEESLASHVKQPDIPSRYATDTKIRNLLRDFINQLRESPVRSFKISRLGCDFLDFVGLPKTAPGSS